MKYNGKNIILDTDVTVTNPSHLGETLSNIIESHESDINTLKSNVSWIYKHGGVGSGTGGSGTTSSPWNFKVELNEVVLEHNNTVNLGKQGEYKLTIQLYKVQNRTFTIKCTHTTNTGVRIIERTISPNQNPVLNEIIDLLVNGTLTVAINDDEGNFDQFLLNYVVTAYSFDLNYVLNDALHTKYIPQDNNIFVNNVKDVGLLADLSYIISVDVVDAYVVYTDWNEQVSDKIPLSKGNGHLRFPLGKELTDENAGNYTFLTEIHLLLLGKDEEEVIPVLKLQDNLIPSNIYLKIESDGIFYANSELTKPYQYYLGTIPFKVVPYQGFADLSSMYNLTVRLNDVDHLNVVLTDQSPSIINVTTDLLGLNKITFILSRKGETFNKSYYFYTKNPLGNFNWYPTQEINGDSYTTVPVISYQYKEGRSIYKHENVKLIPGTSTKLISKLSQDTKSTIYTCDIDKLYLSYDYMFAVGINYNKLNDVNKAILQIGSDNNYIIIYLNKISLFNTDYKIYLPKNEYHLITIYRRSVGSSNALPLFEYSIYIDGVLETSTSTFSTILETYNTIQLDPGLYDINYLELSYFKHNIIENENSFYKYNLNPQEQFLLYLNDEGILYHFYSYKLTFEPESIPENFLSIFTYASLFYNDFYKNRIKVNLTIINGISENLNVPVLVLEYTEERTSTDDWSSDGESFMEWLENHYDIISNEEITLIQYPVKVSWSKGNEVTTLILTDPNMLFRISLQGTSTLLYTSKNLDLFTYTPEEDFVYLYSPNFNSEDPTTFLPEQRFTIKADVVDSSHSNNNSLGKFINTVTTKFGGAQQNNKYSSYIKNTIEGFPILLFIKNSYYINSTKDLPEEDYYYMGIYNFNLGRDSEYNLGYKDLRILPDSIESGFAVTKIPVNKNIDNTILNTLSYLNGFGVAEIRENRNYFDFSQSHPSFLFPVSDSDNDYMFGKLKSNSESILKTSLQNLVDKVSRSSGYIFDQLGKNMLEEGSYTYGYKSEIPQNLVTNYHNKLTREFINASSVLIDTGIKINGTYNDLVNTLLGVDNEMNPAIDYKSLSEYYVICMAFGLVDSVMKNLNLKTWNNETFYTAFYDIDTALLKDNAGNDTNYIAFSDYWEAADHVVGGNTYLDPAISYKDWFDKDINGYDIPMTYLLALAKYGYHISKNEQLIDWYPNNLWARFRRKSLNINGWDKPVGLNENHIGCLTTADSFINKYFKNHLSSIPDVFFNLNYRKKYFILNKENTNGFVNEDFKKFSGKRIYSVRDWLTSRFHLLDLYFNLGAIPDNINVYDLNTQTWESKANLSYALPSNKFIDSTNDDIVILKDIFSSQSSNTKYSLNININIKSEEYSPICLSGETTARYLTKDENTYYTLSLETAGKGLNLGGSGNWTYVSSINTLLQGGAFYVNSDKLTTLYGNSGICSGWTINLPAILEVSLTSPLYSGVLNFDSLSNLNTININGTKLGLEVNNLNATSINASNISYGDILKIVNCSKLNNLNISNSTFKNIIINPITQNIVYFSDTTYKQDDNGEWQKTDITYNSAKCNTLLLTNKNNNGIIFIDNLQFLRNKVYEGLLEITLEGFKEIYIDNCNFLQYINIVNPEIVEKFTVTNCSSQAPYLRINSSENNVINLSEFSKLSELNFYRTSKFTIVKAPDNVTLKNSCFYQTSLLYLLGNGINITKSAFSQSPFTLLQPNGDLCSFNNFDSDLSNTFFGNRINKETFDLFNQIYRKQLANVINTSSMWAYVSSLQYTEEELNEDYTNGKCRFDLSMYTNVIKAQSMFGGINKTTCHPDIFKGFGSLSGVDITDFFGWSNQKEVSIPINWLDNIKDKANKINSSSKDVIYKVLQENSLEQLIEFYPYQLLGSNLITSIENWNFDKNHILNLLNAFDGCSLLNSIQYSFCGCLAKNIQFLLDNISRGFLYQYNKIKNIKGSFGFTNYNELDVNLEHFLPWESLESGNKLFLYAQDWDEKLHVMEFNKTIQSISNFKLILEMLIKNYTANSLAHVFRNCQINNTEEELIFELTYYNNYITQIPYLFSNLITPKGITFDWNLFKILPNVVDLRHCFEKVHFTNMIPFNVFQRRMIENNNVIKYIKDSDIPVKLKTYKYRLDINNLSYCFANCVFDVPAFEMTEYDINSINSPGVAWRETESGEIEYFDYYYDSQSIFATKINIDNSEFKDLEFESSYTATISNITTNTITWQPEEYKNFSLYDSIKLNNPFVSPDFFYGCTNSANLSYCFAGSTLQGYIPDNLFKNSKNANIKHFILDVLILPKIMKDGNSIKQVQDELGNRYNLSYYIGSNFIDSVNLDDAFSFKMSLPGLVRLLEDDLLERDLHIFCFKDSFNKMLESARNMYPSLINDPLENCVFTVQHYSNDILLAVMYDKSSEIDGLIGNIGFDISLTYTKLNADNLINNVFILFGYGRIFDFNTTIPSIKKRYVSTSSWVIQIGNSLGSFGVSKNILLPSAKSNNPGLIYAYSLKYIGESGTWEIDTDNRGVYVLKTSVDGYADGDNVNYNNSRSNSSNYALVFI